MRAGLMDRRITIRRATISYNSFNEPIESWADLVTVWAQWKDATASEAYKAAEIGAEISARFVIRWSTDVRDVNPKDRVLFRNREYNITAVRDVGRNLEREIDAVIRADEE